MPEIENHPDSATEVESKFFLTSKTYLGNVLLASAAELVPGVEHWVSAHPSSSILLVAGLNIILRHFTEEKLHYKPKKLTQS